MNTAIPNLNAKILLVLVIETGPSRTKDENEDERT